MPDRITPSVTTLGACLAPQPAAAPAISHVTPQATPTYNTAFLSDAQLRDVSWSVTTTRNFLASKNSYFQIPVKDVDGVVFDPATVISDAARTYSINPKVLLATLQKESSSVTRTTRPTTVAIMGNTANTWRGQILEAAQLLDWYERSLVTTGMTVSGWKVGQAKLTQDGVWVTPQSAAAAALFTYTPYAGSGWGGTAGGNYLFYTIWEGWGF